MLLPTKSNNKILLFGDHFGPILPILDKDFLPLFFVSRFISVGKISEKTNEQVPRKIGNRYTDRRSEVQLDKSEFIEPLLPRYKKQKVKKLSTKWEKVYYQEAASSRTSSAL